MKRITALLCLTSLLTPLTFAPPALADLVCIKASHHGSGIRVRSRTVATEKCPKGYSKVFDTTSFVASNATAGGALTGTYPNPALGSGVVTSSNIAFGAVGTSNLSTFPGVRVKQSLAALSIPDNQLTAITFDTEDRDDMSFFPGSGSDITIPVDGTYLMTGEIVYTANASGVRLLSIISTNEGRLASQIAPGSANGNQVSVATVAKLVAGDVITLNTTQNSSSPINTANLAGGVGNAYFAIQWIAP